MSNSSSNHFDFELLYTNTNGKDFLKKCSLNIAIGSDDWTIIVMNIMVAKKGTILLTCKHSTSSSVISPGFTILRHDYNHSNSTTVESEIDSMILSDEENENNNNNKKRKSNFDCNTMIRKSKTTPKHSLTYNKVISNVSVINDHGRKIDGETFIKLTYIIKVNFIELMELRNH